MRGRSSSSSNTRWCPTPEQVMVLDELYRRGLRNPNAPQIQKITAHLSLYGSIQGKNVFYWFQNHKARDRQKLRKKQLLLLHQQHQQHQLLLHHQHFYQYPQTLHLHTPSPQNIHFQRFEEVPSAKDWPLMKTYGHDDSVMIMEVGHTFPSCSRRSNPLQTLELFPLSSPTAANHQ